MSSSSILSKIIDISEARNRGPVLRKEMSNQADERRVDMRRSSEERLFIQIVASNDSDLVGTTISCKTKDVSASGMRITSASTIPNGCKLDIWIDVLDKPGKFFLTSDVMWSKRLHSGQCELGIQLSEGATTDIGAWRTAHA